MDLTVRNRLEVVWKKLDGGKCETRAEKDWARIRQQRVGGILKRWKYRPKRVPRGMGGSWNRFLPRNLQRLTPLYEDLVVVAAGECHGARLRDLDGLLQRCRGIQEASGSVVADWDDKWINPLSLASKGWEYASGDGKGRVNCLCQACRRTIVLDLACERASSPYLRHSYWVNGISGSHGPECPWKDVQFDLEKEYYLRESNLAYDIERITKALAKDYDLSELGAPHETLLQDQLTQLMSIFRYNGDARLLDLLLRGFQPVEDNCDVASCSACFRKMFIRSRSKLNYHESWCRYRQESRLAEMLLRSLPLDSEDAEKSDSIGMRLHKLEKYLEDL